MTISVSSLPFVRSALSIVLGQYVGVGMDRIHHFLGLLAKHLDVQIALLVAPEFSGV